MSAVVTAAPAASALSRIAVLDGWRAASILCVLAGHWFPLGPQGWGLNSSFATGGMAMFFCLSGFLITQLLIRDPRVGAFLIRRLARIVPLAWAAMLALAFVPGNLPHLPANLGFYSNLPPVQLMEGGHHLWSLCVEAQFYVTVALIVLIAGRRGLYVLPVLALTVTALRIIASEPQSIVTWHRVDEILVGATLGLIAHSFPPGVTRLPLPSWSPLVFAVLLLASANPEFPTLQYARPYLAALAIGTSLYTAPRWFERIWTSAPARYVAEISYAVYIMHGVFTATWLGGEDASKFDRYARRPLLVLATWAAAHFSTFYFEQRFIALGKKLTRRQVNGAEPAPVTHSERTTI